MTPRWKPGTARLTAGLLVALAIAACTTTSPTQSPTSTPAASPTPGVACPVAEQTGALRSNTLTGMEIRTTVAADQIVFTLGAIAPGPTGSAGRLKAVEPPFSEGGSGLPVEVLGEHFVELHFDGMLLVDESGTVLYTGETSVMPDVPALRQVEMTEAFEGVYNFVIGYDGAGCVTLTDDAAARTLTISLGH